MAFPPGKKAPPFGGSSDSSEESMSSESNEASESSESSESSDSGSPLAAWAKKRRGG